MNRQIVTLPKHIREQLDLAITLSMEHGDEIIINLNEDEDLILTADFMSGTISGWIESVALVPDSKGG